MIRFKIPAASPLSASPAYPKPYPMRNVLRFMAFMAIIPKLILNNLSLIDEYLSTIPSK